MPRLIPKMDHKKPPTDLVNLKIHCKDDNIKQRLHLVHLVLSKSSDSDINQNFSSITKAAFEPEDFNKTYLNPTKEQSLEQNVY